MVELRRGATRPRTRRDEAIEALRAWIIDGRFTPGDRLVESALAEELGMSRVPVREALHHLNAEGFVELDPGHSATVAQRSGRDIIEMFEVREVIEGLVCALAASRGRQADISRLRTLSAHGRASAEAGVWDDVRDGNATLHEHLATMAGNQHLLDLVRTYRTRLAWQNAPIAVQRGVEAWTEHDEIIDAIAAGDAELAERLGRRHVRHARQAFIDAFLAGDVAVY